MHIVRTSESLANRSAFTLFYY